MQSLTEDLLHPHTGNLHANLGHRWPNRFLACHLAFCTTWLEPLLSARAAAGLPEILVCWAEKLWAHCSNKELDSTDLWNFDEKGFRQVACTARSLSCDSLVSLSIDNGTDLTLGITLPWWSAVPRQAQYCLRS